MAAASSGNQKLLLPGVSPYTLEELFPDAVSAPDESESRESKRSMGAEMTQSQSRLQEVHAEFSSRLKSLQDERLRITLANNTYIVGVLKGFDDQLNLIIDIAGASRVTYGQRSYDLSERILIMNHAWDEFTPLPKAEKTTKRKAEYQPSEMVETQTQMIPARGPQTKFFCWLNM